MISHYKSHDSSKFSHLLSPLVSSHLTGFSPFQTFHHSTCPGTIQFYEDLFLCLFSLATYQQMKWSSPQWQGLLISHITLKTEAVRILATQSVSNWCHSQKQKLHPKRLFKNGMQVVPKQMHKKNSLISVQCKLSIIKFKCAKLLWKTAKRSLDGKIHVHNA